MFCIQTNYAGKKSAQGRLNNNQTAGASTNPFKKALLPLFVM
ncbi:hypothetical protein NIASO_19770 [Niabella soli DSM 19437]|uniref:Uncharacterized protein n=1 Tax=Niabella soli DSM 19437 TaxID=929713 RepID=W0F4R4_9BACT|nr:hypothetical protein NIASO_19770 [Niabella soli DSM 19437]